MIGDRSTGLTEMNALTYNPPRYVAPMATSYRAANRSVAVIVLREMIADYLAKGGEITQCPARFAVASKQGSR